MEKPIWRSVYYRVRSHRTRLLFVVTAVALIYYSGIFTAQQYTNGILNDVEDGVAADGAGARAVPVITGETPEAFKKTIHGAASPGGAILAHISCFPSQFALAANFYTSSIAPLHLKPDSLFFFPDGEDARKAGELGIPSYHYKSPLGFGGLDLSAETAQDKSVYRHLVTYDILLTGVDALTTSADMYWFKTPLPEVARACGDCDIVVQKEEELDINLGIVYVRHTNASLVFYQKLVAEINRAGIANSRSVFAALLRSSKKTVRVVTLDKARFPDGPEYFEAGGGDSGEKCEECIAVNENHVLGLEARILRLQEHNMWALERGQYYSDPKAKYIIYDNAEVDAGDGEDVAALKAALGVAMALDRKLILPRTFRSGDQHVPLNALFLIEEFHNTFHDYYRESTFLRNPLVPQNIRENICGPVLVENDFTRSHPDLIKSGDEKLTVLKAADSAGGATAQELVTFLRSKRACAVIRFRSLYRAFSGFENRKDNHTYMAQLEQGLVSGTYRQRELLGRSETAVDTEGREKRPSTTEVRYQHRGAYMDDLLTPESVAAETKFTVMMPFFNRKATLGKILTHYLKMSKVDKLVLLWYKELKDMPTPEQLVSDKNLNKKLLVKHMREDNLMIRYILFPEVTTKAILSCDDDLIVYQDDLYKEFETWKKHPHGIVGPFMRLAHRLSPGHYKYVWNPKTHYNIVLTNVAFFHRDWVHVLEADLPPAINSLVREWTNCEDIALNFLVTSHCRGQAVYHVTPVKAPNHFSKLSASLSGRKSHALQRDLCVTKFVKEYDNANPLLTFESKS